MPGFVEQVDLLEIYLGLFISMVTLGNVPNLLRLLIPFDLLRVN